MAKDRPIPHLKALTIWLTTDEGTLPDEVKADAERAKKAIDGKDAGAIAGLSLAVQTAAVEALTQKRDIATLLSLEEKTAQKDVRKAVGRAMHILKTKGVKVEEAPRESAAFRYHTVDGEQPRSYASITDPEGDRMVWLGVTNKQEGRMAFQAVINEVNGLGLFQIFPQMTSKIRRLILAELEEKKIPVYEVDADYARWLIEDGVRKNKATSTDVPKEYFQAEPYLGEFQDLHADPHPIYGILMDKDLAGEPKPEEVARGKELHEIEEVSGWVAQGEIIDGVEKEVDEATGSKIIESEAQRRQQLQPIFEKAAREWLTPEHRQRWLKRLLDLGQHLMSRNKPELARLAVAIGDDLANESSDAGNSPFVVELFYKWYKVKAEIAVAKLTESDNAAADAADEAFAGSSPAL